MLGQHKYYGITFNNSQIENYCAVQIAENTDSEEAYGFWTTALIKTAIRGIITSRSFAGAGAANALDKNFSVVVNELNKILSQSSLVTQSVHDAVFRGLRNAYVSDSIATNVAHAIKECLDVFLP